MNRNLWLVLFGSISVVSLMIAHKAGHIYKDGDYDLGQLVVSCPSDVVEALTAVSEAYIKARPKTRLRPEVVEADTIERSADPDQPYFDLKMSEWQSQGRAAYRVVISEGAGQRRAVQSWLEFLASPGAQAPLNRHGFVSILPDADEGEGPDAVQIIRIVE
jgi:ABC-type molybdate transport system substrate-binding protein